MTTFNGLIIGVDFGTTNTGVAYQHTSRQDPRPDMIQDWPGGSATVKVPSEVAYFFDDSGNQIETAKDIHKNVAKKHHKGIRDCLFGFEIDHNQSRLVYFKLFQTPASELPPGFSAANDSGEMRKYQRVPTDPPADFLKKALDHSMKSMTKIFGEDVHTMPRQLILSVPASWKSLEIARARKAFHLAGYEVPMVVTEPEAAAHHAIQELNVPISVGELILIVDCGGGTVDTVTHRIKSKDPLVLSKATEGRSCICGSELINLAFKAKVKEKLGAESFNRMMEMNSRGWRTASRYFDVEVKRNITASTNKQWQVPLPGEAEPVYQGCLPFSSQEIRDLFEPSIRKVHDMIIHEAGSVHALDENEQISRIILAGGFGNSAYLFSELEKRVEPRFLNSESVKILKSQDAWSAVARGIVQMALKGVVKPTYIAWPHYGVAIVPHEDDPFSAEETQTPGDEQTQKRKLKSKKRKLSTESVPVQPILEAFQKLDDRTTYKVELKNMPSGSRSVDVDILLITSGNSKCPKKLGGSVKEEVRLHCNLAQKSEKFKVSKKTVFTASLENNAGKLTFKVSAGEMVFGQVEVELRQV